VNENSYGLPDDYVHFYSGKVRDLYRTPQGNVLIVASDRISAYDWILDTPIPEKGTLLTQISVWWFEQVADIVPNHLAAEAVPQQVAGRGIIVQPLEMYPVECVVRGYLAGSGLSDYQSKGSVCGVPLPEGLVEGSQLPDPIFTPATKAALGEHDENVAFRYVEELLGAATAEELRDLSLAVYARGREIAAERGIIVADTKFEFGAAAGEPFVLADEIFTPDSSRFWPIEEWRPGGPQPSFDKQFVRDWLTSPESGWSRDSGLPPPPLPAGVVARTRQRYVEAYERLTGTIWPQRMWAQPPARGAQAPESP